VADIEKENNIPMGRQIILHLLPGALVTIVYAPLAYVFHRNGLPSILGFFAASILILFPLQIGLPILLERRKKPGLELTDIFLYRDKQPAWQIALLVLGSLLWAGLVFLIGGSALVDPLREALFAWVPEWFDMGYYLLHGQEYSAAVRITTWALGILFAALIGPTIEEFYFRSYLLPRMSALKWWAPLAGGILMSLYHFWSPWMFIIRVVAIMPLVYAVWWKRNVTIGIIAHCLLNLVGDVLMSIPLVFI
jgi:membrane protease YdiL (CAAX protease family)